MLPEGPADGDKDDPAYDAIVVGSGSSGMTSAIVAAQAGLTVLLVEKSEYFGGITALSGGGCWIPGNHLAEQAGMPDTRAEAETYITQVVGNYLRKDMLKAFLDEGPDMVRYMVENTEVQFVARTPAPDYDTRLPGSKIGGRSLGSVLYDGRKLGRWFKKLRPPIAAFNAPAGMMMGPIELYHYNNRFTSAQSAWYIVKLFGRYARDRLTHGRGTRLTMGNAMAARFLKSAIDAGVTLWSSAAAKRLITDDGGVTGLVVEKDGREIAIKARRGVVLATGGFSANAEMRKAYFPFADQHQTMVPASNTGDGLNMARAAGAVMDQPNRRNGVLTVVSLWRKRNGTVVKNPHFFMDLPKPGLIAVNMQGRRFGNEAGLELASAIQDSGSVPAWLVVDSAFVQKNGFGLVWPGGIRKAMLRRAGYLIEGRTIRELAGKIGVPADALEASVARNNANAVTGKDPDFGRGDADLDRTMGDPMQKPNPNIGPIEKAPFYAIEVFPGDVSSTAGLKANPNAQVLDANDRPIPGLYVCGVDMNSLWAGHGLANGTYHGLNMTFGYIIGRQLAGIESKSGTKAAIAAA